jgi:flagellar hook assembly protein FlgD
LPKESNVQLAIYDITGREVRTLVADNQAVGYKEVLWDGKDNNGSQVSSGIYIFHFKASSLADGKVFEKSSKLVLLK